MKPSKNTVTNYQVRSKLPKSIIFLDDISLKCITHHSFLQYYKKHLITKMWPIIRKSKVLCFFVSDVDVVVIFSSVNGRRKWENVCHENVINRI